MTGWSTEWVDFRRQARIKGPLWIAGQALLTLAALWLVWALASGAARWALDTARWEVISANLRLLAIGRYPATEAPGIIGSVLLGEAGATGVWRPWAALIALSAGIGLADGIGGRRGSSVFIAKSIGALLVLPLLSGPVAMIGPALADLLEAFSAGRTRFAIALVTLGVGWVIGSQIRAWAPEDFRSRRRLLVAERAAWALGLLAACAVIAGLEPWLDSVPSGRWGGLLLTLILAAVSIALSFPVGVLLALGRRSTLPLVRVLCVSYIELIRGVPLVTVLYMASLMLPLVLGQDIRPPDVLKGIAGLTAFSAAYLAEDVRGGLAAVGRGQFEAAQAVGLGTFATYRLIVLPQAIRAVIPAVVGQFISLFKDTSLVIIIGLRELLGTARTVAAQDEFIGLFREALVFIAIIYFVFSLTMSRESRRLEARLSAGDEGSSRAR